jgi:hypothetical protein
MLVLVLAVEALAGRWCSLEFHSVGLDWALTKRRAGEQAARYDVLCFGDSQMKLDVQPRVMAPILGQPVLNLSVIAGEAPSSYYLLRRALAAGARPRAVVVDFFHPLLAAPLAMNQERWPLVLSFGEAAELGLNAAEPDVVTHWLLRKALPTFAFRDQVRAAVRGAVGASADDARVEGLALLRNTELNAGAIAGQEDPRYADDPSLLPVYERPMRFASSGVHALYLRKFLALAGSRGIPVFWVLSPCSPNWQRRSAELDPDRKYERAIRRELEAFPHVRVVDGRYAGYGRERFYDKSHLDRRGAAAFSADLARIMDRELGREASGERWISMPAYRPSAMAGRVEGLDESRRIVRTQGDAVYR